MSTALRLALGKLLQSPDSLAGSQLTAAQRRALDDFARQTGAVTSQPSGRGLTYRVALPAVATEHWRALTPGGDDPGELPERAANIARTGSSKGARHHHDVHYLLLKSTTDISWQNGDGYPLDLPGITRRQGAAALAIDNRRDAGWHSQSSLWLVENQALFDRLDWLPDDGPATVAHYGGNLRNDLIHWLSARPRASQILFFPDYDGVGLLNYARLKQHLGAAVTFWLMPQWQRRLQQFGSNALWQDTAREFQAALTRLSPLRDAGLAELIDTMQRQGLALEQEAAWLSLEPVVTGCSER